MTSCVKDGIIECPPAATENIRIELEWLNTQPKDDGESLNLAIIPTTGEEIDDHINQYGKDVELAPGTYNFVVWESAENVTVSGQNISVATAEGYALDPGKFSGGATTAEIIITPDSIVIPVPIHQQTRELIIEVDFAGDAISIVEGLEATLSGVTLERDINNGFPPTDNRNRPPAIRNGSILYSFNRGELRLSDEWFSGSRHLLGVDGDHSQELNLRVKLATGDTEEVSLDVTGDLIEFHTKDIHEPWYIILKLNLGINLELEIVDWYAGAESWLIAN